MLDQQHRPEPAPSAPVPAPTGPAEPEARAALAATGRWLRPWMAVVVAVLGLVTVVTAFAQDMPEFHHLAVPAATAVILAAWAIELSGLGWPRLLLVLGVALPNVWLTLIGHASANYLFLILLVGWVGVVGSRAENAAALALALATLALGIGLDAMGGPIAWASWTSWLVGLLLVWSMALVLGRQDRLVAELRRLRSQAEERTRELAALYRADETLHRSLQVDDVLQALVDEATAILGADKTTVLVWDATHEHLVPGASRGFSPETLARMRHGPGQGVTAEVARTGQPIAVEDTAVDPRVVHHITDPEQIRSLLHVPITVGAGEVFGVFGVNYCQPHHFSGEEQRLLSALAQRAALAIDNARLYAQTEQRSREIEGLYRADAALHASLKLDEVLQALVEVATDLLGADKTAVMVWDAAHQRLEARAGRGFSPATLARMVHGPGEGVTWRVAETGVPIAVSDVRQDPRVARHLSDPEGIRSFLQVPITVGGEVFGVFGINHCQLHTFTADEQRVLLALAQRAALAIQNARLYEQAEGKAALEERERLARELHDSVTQSLYGAALYAEAAARALADGEPGPAAVNVQELRDTIQEALGEMRLLLFELRPPLLQEQGLAGALQSRLQAVEARTGLATVFHGTASERLAPEVEQELFRIAQEALNNVLKHAHATRVSVRLDVSDERVLLEIADNGLGFEPALGGGGGFGLAGMRERAQRLGGTVQIDSAPGAGTRVRVEAPR